MKWRTWILLAAILVAIILVYNFPTIPQDQAYHNFADKRQFLDVPNCLDVFSNVFFLFVGLLGMRFVSHSHDTATGGFIDPRERWPWLAFFGGITLTAFGSAYYHWSPNDRTLLWDRIPMALAFMALVAAVIAERIRVNTGTRLLLPLLVFGAGSVVYWSVPQANGHGDLRPYVLVQFGCLPVLLLLLVIFEPRYTSSSDLIIALVLYAIAKIFEVADHQIFSLGGIVSGHTLKHVAAALSAYWVLRMLQRRAPVTGLGVS